MALSLASHGAYSNDSGHVVYTGTAVSEDMTIEVGFYPTRISVYRGNDAGSGAREVHQWVRGIEDCTFRYDWEAVHEDADPEALGDPLTSVSSSTSIGVEQVSGEGNYLVTIKQGVTGPAGSYLSVIVER